jgi:hypothetical protein
MAATTTSVNANRIGPPWAEARHYVHSVVIWTVPTVEVLEDGVAVFHGKVLLLLFVDSNLLTRNYLI